jgi:heterogeneous nuclear ribonucleoprotein K
VFSNIAPQSSDRVVQVIGKEEQCIESLLEVIELIKGTPIKGPIHNYDPHNFDDIYADEYGGYGTGMNGSNSKSVHFNDRGNNNARFNRNNINNNNGSKDRGRRFDFVDPWAHNGGKNGNITSFGGNGNMPSLTSLMGQNGGFNNNNNNLQQQDMDGKSSTQVTIPKDVRFLSNKSFSTFS